MKNPVRSAAGKLSSKVRGSKPYQKLHESKFHQKFQGSRFNGLLKKVFREQEARQWNNWLAVALQLAAAYVLYFVIEALARHSVSEAWTFLMDYTHVFFYNGLLIFLTTLPAFLFRKRRLYRFIVFSIWGLLGVVNSFVLSSRVTPLTGPDFKNITEAMSVAKKYFTGVELLIFLIIIIILILFLVIYIFRSPRYKGKMYYYINLPVIVLCCLGFWKLTDYYIDQNILSSYFGNITCAYEDYGFPYCFGVTLFDTGMSEPNNYSAKMITDIEDDAKSAVGETDADLNDMPNIIVVQLESYFDLTRVKGLKFNEDPLPNWHALCEEYTSGLYRVPTFGAGTVNTEFETLTGMSMRFFGAGEYPYKSILKEEACESAAFVLKDLGYTAFALHDNEANFYSRKVVYKNLGFDYFISGEYMLNQSDVNENGWMRDENLIDPMMDCLDYTKGSDFLYTVSVQPHGSYPTEQVLEDPEITVSGSNLTEEQMYAWEYYANQVHEEDQFIADLISAVEDRGEPTIILFYGDHLPSMNLTDSDLTDGTTYDTCYLMWDNLGLEQEDAHMASYQALATIFDKVGIHEGSIFTYQQSNMKHRDSEFSSKLQALQYDLLYGEQYLYSYKEYIPNVDYRLGLYDPEIDSIASISDNIYVVTGNHFTESCRVFDNDEMLESVFVDCNRLLVINSEINGGDEITVGVQSNSKTHKILSWSPETYTVPTYDLPDADLSDVGETPAPTETPAVETEPAETEILEQLD